MNRKEDALNSQNKKNERIHRVEAVTNLKMAIADKLKSEKIVPETHSFLQMIHHFKPLKEKNALLRKIGYSLREPFRFYVLNYFGPYTRYIDRIIIIFHSFQSLHELNPMQSYKRELETAFEELLANHHESIAEELAKTTFSLGDLKQLLELFHKLSTQVVYRKKEGFNIHFHHVYQSLLLNGTMAAVYAELIQEVDYTKKPNAEMNFFNQNYDLIDPPKFDFSTVMQEHMHSLTMVMDSVIHYLPNIPVKQKRDLCQNLMLELKDVYDKREKSLTHSNAILLNEFIPIVLHYGHKMREHLTEEDVSWLLETKVFDKDKLYEPFYKEYNKRTNKGMWTASYVFAGLFLLYWASYIALHYMNHGEFNSLFINYINLIELILFPVLAAGALMQFYSAAVEPRLSRLASITAEPIPTLTLDQLINKNNLSELLSIVRPHKKQFATLEIKQKEKELFQDAEEKERKKNEEKRAKELSEYQQLSAHQAKERAKEQRLQQEKLKRQYLTKDNYQDFYNKYKDIIEEAINEPGFFDRTQKPTKNHGKVSFTFFYKQFEENGLHTKISMFEDMVRRVNAAKNTAFSIPFKDEYCDIIPSENSAKIN